MRTRPSTGSAARVWRVASQHESAAMKRSPRSGGPITTGARRSTVTSPPLSVISCWPGGAASTCAHQVRQARRRGAPAGSVRWTKSSEVPPPGSVSLASRRPAGWRRAAIVAASRVASGVAVADDVDLLDVASPLEKLVIQSS